MRHAPGSILSLLLAGSLAACSCSTRPGVRRDGGGGDPDAAPGDDCASPGHDSNPPDAWFERVDSGPEICDMTTPVMNEIIGDPPDMLLVTDISGSMCTPLIDMFPFGMTSKLAIMKMALTELVTTWDSRINFGMMLFPGDGACGAGTVTNPIMPRNASAISARLAMLADDLFGCALMNTGATPTPISIDAARSYYASIPPNPIGRYVLLATDGLPNCGPELPDGGTEETIDETVAAIAALQADGIDTFVLGFGADLSGGGDALMRMATAGGTGMPYNARSAAELDLALDMIAADIIPASCTIMLDGPVVDPALLQVSFDGGALIPRDESHGSGWDYDPATNTITFYGAECTAVETGGVVDISVDFGCPGPLI